MLKHVSEMALINIGETTYAPQLHFFARSKWTILAETF